MTIVITNDAPTIAGGENYVLFLAEGLRQRGHRVLVAPLAGSELAAESAARAFETIPIAYATGGVEFARARTLAAALSGAGVDIVHSNSNFDRTIGALAARRLRARSIASIHSCLSIRRNLTHRVRNRWWIDHFTPVGHSTRELLMREDGIAAERITVVHIGIPESQIRYSDDGRLRVRSDLGIPESAPVVGTVSRLVDFKGHTHLLHAVPALRARVPDLRVLIAGDGPLRRPLEAEARSLGIADAVVFAGRRADVSDVLSAIDVFAQPSIDNGGETFPVSLIEALAAGRPAVASDVADIRFIIEDGRSGTLVPPARPALLADALTGLLLDQPRREAMAREARGRYLASLTLERMIDAMESVYRRVLGRP